MQTCNIHTYSHTQIIASFILLDVVAVESSGPVCAVVCTMLIDQEYKMVANYLICQDAGKVCFVLFIFILYLTPPYRLSIYPLSFVSAARKALAAFDHQFVEDRCVPHFVFKACY